MKYERIEKAVFLERENRFVAYVELEGKREKVHVKNTGRCEELLIPGAEVYLQKSENEKRATLWDLIAVKKGERLVNLDSQIPNRCVEEWLQTGNLFKEIQCIRPEITYGDSRLDLYAEGDGKKAFIEVKVVEIIAVLREQVLFEQIENPLFFQRIQPDSLSVDRTFFQLIIVYEMGEFLNSQLIRKQASCIF